MQTIDCLPLCILSKENVFVELEFDYVSPDLWTQFSSNTNLKYV